MKADPSERTLARHRLQTAEQHYTPSSEAAGLPGARGPLPSFAVTLQAFYCVFKKLGQSCSPCLWGSPSFPASEVFLCVMLLQKISLLQLPPVSDITDFSHLTCKHLVFSAPTFSPCQLLSKSVSLHVVCLQKGLGWKSIPWHCSSVGAEQVSNRRFYLQPNLKD